MTQKKRMTVRADQVLEGDDILIRAKGCDPQVIGTAATSAVGRGKLAEFRVKAGIRTYTRRHWSSTKIIVERSA